MATGYEIPKLRAGDTGTGDPSFEVT